MIRWNVCGALLVGSLSAAATIAACGATAPESLFDDTNRDAGSERTDPDPGPGPGPTFDDGSLTLGDGNDLVGALAILPADAVIDFVAGTPLPTLLYKATAGGQPVAASWSIDRGEIATIPAGTGVLTPKGTVAGKATVTATYRGKTATTSVTVKIHVLQNGGVQAGDAGAADGGGTGGKGGVGGEGPGGPVSDATKATLLGGPTADPGLGWLYPYDKTVWPRGILSPLMQWRPGAQAYDAVYVHVTESAFEYQGFFAKTASPFLHHPIPQDVWRQIAYSNAGEDVTVTLVFSKGTVAYGPITETWKIAPGTLKGTVYYDSYGTNLAKNYCCTVGGQGFGGATLAIKGGSTDPVLVAGNDQNCRVCHSVAANGSTLVTQHGESYATSSAYALTSGNAETVLTPGDGRFTYGAISPDGSRIFTNGSPAGGGGGLSALYALPSSAPIASTGIPAGLGAGTPAFSPDGKHIAYNFFGGAGADQRSLASIDFAAPSTFSNPLTIFTPPAGTAVWPSFLPTNDGVVFELETQSNGRDFAGTRSSCEGSGACSNSGARGELWWADLRTKKAHRLDKANGLAYMPTGPNAHDADATLNYEPTVNPVPSGGYAWVVFTSRRLYGNVATINPYWSDPRFHDISVNPTPKKLWVAAIDLNAAPDTDPSHPAFYLPAQELLAGNARGFWVVDPCHMDGTACDTGDECCGGFCRPSEDGGPLTCEAQAPGCAQEFEKCATTGDCCGNGQGVTCINGRCAVPQPK